MAEDPANREALESTQLARLRQLLSTLVQHNEFWAPRLRAAGLDGELDDVRHFSEALSPVTKGELAADQQRHPPFGTNLSEPVEHYVRFHQTSGTTGVPMRWLDTAAGWDTLLSTWQKVLGVAGIGPADRIFIPFSFGPFLGFWTAFEAATRLGCLTIPGGGMGSKGRLEVLLENGATAFCATPTYAIRLAEVAREEGFDLGRSRVRKIFVAGEPGGSVPSVRQRIADLWPGAEVFDHHGMTEVGPVSFPNPRFPGLLHIDENAFLAEIVDPESGAPVADGEEGELLLTTLLRPASPLLRYRTGDLVRRSTRPIEELGFPEMALEGGILSRVDDMVVVRGVNLYPSAIDEVVRSLGGVAEYRVWIESQDSLKEVRVEIEPAPAVDDPDDVARRLEDAFRRAFQLRIPVSTVGRGQLPRFELKAKRWHSR